MIPARWQLLSDQKQVLLKQREKIDDMLHCLEYKIGRYEDAMKTGKLVWDEPPGVTARRTKERMGFLELYDISLEAQKYRL